VCVADGCEKCGVLFSADPHIKVTGTKEAVTEAKEKILNILNTKVPRLRSFFCPSLNVLRESFYTSS